MTPATLLQRGMRELALPTPADGVEKLLAYLELMAKWNRSFNLTALRDRETMVTHHLLDSLAVVRELPAGRLADVGAGAGLPGVPIAIAQPERLVTLNDSSDKKCAFLRQTVIELRLGNLRVHPGRVENWRPRERFDIVICRGFAALGKFVASCRHLLAPGGVLAAMKGTFPREELQSVAADCDCSDVRRLRVPLLDAERHLVICRPSS